MTGAARDADVIVAGAGPGGAATAAHLARAGVNVLLLERGRFPRDKVCGDFVGPVALAELAALGVTPNGALSQGNRVDRAALFGDGVELVTYALPALDGLPQYGCVIPRCILDAAIADGARRAGARLEEGLAVTGFRRSEDGIEVTVRDGQAERRLRASVLVGADGAGSIVARILRGGAPQRDEFIVAVRGYFEGVGGPLERCDLSFTTESFPGYAWVFPTKPGEANVGVGMVVDTFPSQKQQMRELLDELIQRDPAMRARLDGARSAGNVAGWPLATYSGRTPVAFDRVVLVGDAAGLINPLNGEGIQAALCSARWAADAIAGALARGDVSPRGLAGYPAVLRRELGDDMLLARMVVRAIANRALNPVWLAMLRAVAGHARFDERYALASGGVMAGIVPVREAFATPIVLASAGAILAEFVRLVRGAAHAGPRAASAAFVRNWAPAAEVLWDSGAALRWLRSVVEASRDVAASRKA